MSVFQAAPPNQKPLALSLGIESSIIQGLCALDPITDAGVIDTVARGFNLVYDQSLVKKHINALVERVITRSTEQATKPSKPNFRTGKSLGTQYMEWLSGLNGEQICLYLADYDAERAYHFYWFTDVDFISKAAELKGQNDSQRAMLGMESCLYGFGGKYQDDDGNAVDHDIDNDEGAVLALRSLGF